MKIKLCTLALILGIAAPSFAEKPDCGGGYIGFTFDDGPNPTYTPRLLDTLRAEHIRATFFLLGVNAEKYPELVRQIVREGHTLGNHTYDHKDLTTLSAVDAAQDIQRTQTIIQSITGKSPRWFRPPYGHSAGIPRQLNLSDVLWTSDSRDWEGNSAQAIMVAVRRMQSGGIVIMHDHGPHTIEALSLIGTWLRTNHMCGGLLTSTTERMPSWSGGTTEIQSFFVKATAKGK